MDFKIDSTNRLSRELIATWREFFHITGTPVEEQPLLEFGGWRPALLVVNPGLGRAFAEVSPVALREDWAAHPHFQQFQALAEKQLPVVLLGASPLLNSNFVVSSEGGLEPLDFGDARVSEDWDRARVTRRAATLREVSR